MLELEKIDKSWTLFLDRDGVINHEKHREYVLDYLQFQFYDGVKEALKGLSGIFGRLIIVTNQRGVEKALMTEQALLDIHRDMLAEIRAAGGDIDAIFYCTSLDDDHPNRKPQTGMARLAKESYPDIDFSRSVMIGNNLSDMQFGKNAGMFTVFVKTTLPDLPLPDPLIDLACSGLPDFAAQVVSLHK
ncbi:MAG: HAD-IIIA family hydrolase [Williamsia sp.]|nr:HAD-IIIA family hydrolase [Williamsia sp.]